MILHNGDVLFGWPLQSHVITAGWFYNDGSLHRALDFRAAVGTPVYAAADGTVETAYRWNGRNKNLCYWGCGFIFHQSFSSFPSNVVVADKNSANLSISFFLRFFVASV